MNMLRKLVPLRSAFARLMETSVEASPKIIAEPLTERELVSVQGDEVVPFLQGLVTNDMAHLQTEHSSKTASMYAMFLNKSGRVMFDSIIYRAGVPNTFYIECDKNVSSDLKRHLRLYRVRRKIEIESADKEYKPWVVFSANSSSNIDTSGLKPECYTTLDPRFKDLGHRVLLSSDMTWGDLSKMLTKSGQPDISTPSPECNYRLHRYRHGVGEGVNDIPPGKCFPLEANCDFLHGVSFHKGCYIGQELTARVYHTGVIRKRLMPLRLTKNPKKVTTVQSLAGANLGTLRGFVDKSALALMRVQQVLNSTELIIDGESCYAEKPFWWPKELPSKASVREGN